jgi:hypothetical protein
VRKCVLLVTLMSAVLPMSAHADSSPLDEMKQKCEKEKTSMFRENNGTPTCARLEKIYRDYEAQTQGATAELRQRCEKEQASLFKENNGAPSCSRLNDALRDRATDPVGQGYRYSKERGKYCYFNDAGQIQSCP